MDNVRDAYQMVSSAIHHGKPVISTNATMLATCLPELAGLLERFQVSLLYGGAVSYCMPMLHGIKSKQSNQLQHLSFINDAHSNYVLDKIFEKGLEPAADAINGKSGRYNCW